MAFYFPPTFEDFALDCVLKVGGVGVVVVVVEAERLSVDVIVVVYCP